MFAFLEGSKDQKKNNLKNFKAVKVTIFMYQNFTFFATEYFELFCQPSFNVIFQTNI